MGGQAGTAEDRLTAERQKVSKPRAPSFGREQRSRLARRAATARWARLGRGVLALAQIRAAVVEALARRETEATGKHKPRAYLFGSYARGDATARSDLDIMVIVEEMPYDWPSETVDLTSAIHKALGDDNKGIDLLMADEATFEDYKESCNSVYCDIHTEGIRLC